MRKGVFFIFVVVGAAVGLISALTDVWGVRAVMMTIGAVVGAAIGGPLTRFGARSKPREPAGLDESHGQGTSAEDRDRNYWRDKGYPPFMKPPSAEPDRHMYDPDRLD